MRKATNIGSLIEVLADVVNDSRRRYPSYSREQRKFLKDGIAALLYYLPQFPKNEKFRDETGKWAVNNHTYPRSKAALELLTTPEDATASDLLRAYKERYGVIEFVSHRQNKTIPHFKPSDLDYMTSEERKCL